MCTLLLRGALHKDHFSKITTWLPFIPYFWKPSCFLRLPLLPLFLQPPPQPPPPPPLPHPSLSCFSFHMLVLFFLIFPLCKKWKAENRMSKGGEKKKEKGRRQKQRLYIGEITVCSAETTLSLHRQLWATIQAGNHIHIHHTPQSKTPSTDGAECCTCPALFYCMPMCHSHSMTRGTALISHRQLHKKHPLNRIRTYKLFEKRNPAHACFSELVINHAHCSVTGAAMQG